LRALSCEVLAAKVAAIEVSAIKMPAVEPAEVATPIRAHTIEPPVAIHEHVAWAGARRRYRHYRGRGFKTNTETNVRCSEHRAAR